MPWPSLPVNTARFALMQELLQLHPGMHRGERSAALDCSRSGCHAHRRKARLQRRAQVAALARQIRASFLTQSMGHQAPISVPASGVIFP
ncbi:MAG: hypothetical protein ABIP20_10100 [Chthoniobacteraceae bacterium]